MTLTEAVEVLNQHQYRNHGDWRISDTLIGERLEPLTYPPGYPLVGLVPFEVVAVAEKIQRSAIPATPATPSNAAPAQPATPPTPAQAAPTEQPKPATPATPSK